MERHEEILFVLKKHDRDLNRLNLSFKDDELARMMHAYRALLVKELNDLGYTFDSCYKPLHIPNVIKILKEITQ
jgi:hypothetical protein